jgi:hypothetical protein
METLDLYKPTNAFLNYLVDCLCNPKAAEQKEEVATTDGNIVSERALKAALKTGKGVMIGGFFVGSTLNTDLDFGYSLTL